jgi:argininosuccinate lyase
MKLWQKNFSVKDKVESFTTGNDRESDLWLAEFDVLGSLAHTQMLQSIGLLTTEELQVLQAGLKQIYHEIKAATFAIGPGVEDVHSQIEILLTERYGEVGKKIHSGRSRNDQVLVDLKLFIRAQIKEVAQHTRSLFGLLQTLSEQYKDVLLPGYTHTQLAMPSSFGLWFGAYAESLVDDLLVLQSAYRVADQNPLGSAAGYGSSFPLDRHLTTQLLGFETLNFNVVYAQMTRGKTEKITAFGLASIAATLGKLADDICLYVSQNMDFLTFPKEFTTGSSIMPHKKNPDVFELIRAKCNRLQALPNEIAMLLTNLTSGYHRDLQLIKENMLPAFAVLNDCLDMTAYMLENIVVREDILASDQYKYLFSVEVVNNLVLQGVSFRDAYRQVGLEIEAGTFSPSQTLQHVHVGSLGNLGNAQVAEKMTKVWDSFHFERAEKMYALLQ